MQIIYNYVISSVRYSVLFDSNNNEYGNAHQYEFGTLFLNSGVCAGMARTVALLGKKAGLDVVYVAGNGHAWNLFRPAGSKKYYFVDTTDNKFCVGINSSSQSYNGVDYPTSTDFFGSSILVDIDNKSNIKFNISLVDRNNTDVTYCSYDAVSPIDSNNLDFSQLTLNKHKYFYMYSHAYYRLIIKDENGNELLNWDYALNSTPSTKTFKDSSGKAHKCSITINNEKADLNARTDNNARFVISVS